MGQVGAEMEEVEAQEEAKFKIRSLLKVAVGIPEKAVEAQEGTADKKGLTVALEKVSLS